MKVIDKPRKLTFKQIMKAYKELCQPYSLWPNQVWDVEFAKKLGFEVK